MTEKFVSAAELMARVLGADGHPFVTIPHPISSATDEQLAVTAGLAADAIVAILTVGEKSTQLPSGTDEATGQRARPFDA